VGDEPIFAIHDEVPSSPHPRRNEWHADGHALDLLEAAFTLVHWITVHGRKPDVDPLELLNLFIEPPRPRLHLHRVQSEVIAGSDRVNKAATVRASRAPEV
jgi:hypothetical protein